MDGREWDHIADSNTVEAAPLSVSTLIFCVISLVSFGLGMVCLAVSCMHWKKEENNNTSHGISTGILGFGAEEFSETLRESTDFSIREVFDENVANSNDNGRQKQRQRRQELVRYRLEFRKIWSPLQQSESCSICLEGYTVGDILARPKTVSSSSENRTGSNDKGGCNHWFHKKCILEWLQKHNECPLCRVVVKSMVIE